MSPEVGRKASEVKPRKVGFSYMFARVRHHRAFRIT